MSEDPFSAEEAAVAQFISGGSAPAAKFPAIGSFVEGTVTGLRLQQQTDADTKEPLFWENNRPTPQSMLKFPQTARKCDQLLVDLQGEPTGITYQWDAVNERHVEVALDDDDGVRTLYVKGRLQIALAQTLKEAGVKVPKIGSYLKVVRASNVKSKIQGRAYTYDVSYIPPEKNEKAAEAALAGPPEDPFAQG